MIRRILTAVAFLLIGFAVGVYVGYRFLGMPQRQMAVIGESFIASQYAFQQYQQAAYPEARQALEAYIVFLDARPPRDRSSWWMDKNPLLDERGLALDKALTLVRLALLHERNGNATEAEATWQRIDALTLRLHWRDRSREHVREMVLRLDRSVGSSDQDKTTGGGA